MSNLIVLSAESILKYLERQHGEIEIDLPVLGKASVIVKELEFHTDRLCLPIRHNIPLISDFTIDFEKFKCEDTRFSFEIGRVGFIPGFGIDILCKALAGYIEKILSASRVDVFENCISIEMKDLVPDNFRSISIVSIEIASGQDAGIRLEFDF